MPHNPVLRSRKVATGLAVLTAFALVAASCSDDPADVAAPPTTAAPASTVAPTTTLMPDKDYDIVGTALQANIFQQLAGYVVQAGLVEALRGGPFTVFAPVDDAFMKVPVDILHAVQDGGLLPTVLTYHVLATAAYAKDVTTGPVTTVETNKLTLTVANGKVTIADSTAAAANVVFTDVPGRNGVIHVIDKVLIPPGL